MDALSEPLLSAVMPVFNGERFIGQAIESILAQTYRHFEFIIINDASTDRTSFILADYAARDRRIVIIDQPHNQGAAEARNMGIAAAQGIYIAFMDADDIALPERFEHQVRYLHAHPTVDLLGSALRKIDEHNREIGTFNPPVTHNLMLWSMLFINPIVQSSVMVKRSILDESARYDSSYPVSEDFDLWLRLAPRCEFANLQTSLVYYRTQHDYDKSARRRQHEEIARQLRADFLTRLLGERVTPQQLDLLYWLAFPVEQWQRPTFPPQYAADLVKLLSKAYYQMQAQGWFRGNSIAEVEADFAQKVIQVGQATAPFWYWKLRAIKNNPHGFLRARWQQLRKITRQS